MWQYNQFGKSSAIESFQALFPRSILKIVHISSALVRKQEQLVRQLNYFLIAFLHFQRNCSQKLFTFEYSESDTQNGRRELAWLACKRHSRCKHRDESRRIHDYSLWTHSRTFLESANPIFVLSNEFVNGIFNFFFKCWTYRIHEKVDSRIYEVGYCEGCDEISIWSDLASSWGYHDA